MEGIDQYHLKESVCNAGDLGSIPGLGRSPGEGNGNPLQPSCLENPHGQRSLVGCNPWGLEESDMTEWLSTARMNNPEVEVDILLKENPHGSDGKSICLQCGRPGFDPWVGKILWRRKGQSTPVLLPGKFHGWRSLVGYSPWGHKELDTTERLQFQNFTIRKTRKPEPRTDTPGEGAGEVSDGRRLLLLHFLHPPTSDIYIQRYYICLHVCS